MCILLKLRFIIHVRIKQLCLTLKRKNRRFSHFLLYACFHCSYANITKVMVKHDLIHCSNLNNELEGQILLIELLNYYN